MDMITMGLDHGLGDQDQEGAGIAERDGKELETPRWDTPWHWST